MEDQLLHFYKNIFEPNVLEEIKEVGVYKEVAMQERLMDIGQYIKSMPLLLEGAIKIMRVDEEGNELLLYYIERGDTCAMTLSCCLGQSKSEIRAVAEVDTKLLLIPVEKMEGWLVYKSWRNFVFESYNSRLNEMLDAIDSLAFKNMNERLSIYLRNKMIIAKDKTLHLSHHEIALDLNSSRVVISRLLKKLENERKVKIHRNRLEIINL